MFAGLSTSRPGRALAIAKAFVAGLLAGKGSRKEKDAGTCRCLQEHAETRRRADEALRRADAVMGFAADGGSKPTGGQINERGEPCDD